MSERYKNRLWISQQGLCWICLRPMKRFCDPNDPLAVTRDHLLPLAQGGKDHAINFLLAHRICNIRRGGRSGPWGDRLVLLERIRTSPYWNKEYIDPHEGRYRRCLKDGTS